jgi:hypothetical protein
MIQFHFVKIVRRHSDCHREWSPTYLHRAFKWGVFRCCELATLKTRKNEIGINCQGFYHCEQELFAAEATVFLTGDVMQLGNGAQNMS